MFADGVGFEPTVEKSRQINSLVRSANYANPSILARVENYDIPTPGFGDQCSAPELHPCVFISIGFYDCISKFYTLVPFAKEFFYLDSYIPFSNKDKSCIPHPNTMDTIR